METAHTFLPFVFLVLILSPLAGSAHATDVLQPPIDRKAWMTPSPSQPLKLLKKGPARTEAYPSTSDYMRVLERFPLYGERGWRNNYLGRADVGFFGDPDSAEMGLRSMGNYIFVMSLLASDPAYDERVTGFSQAELLDRARACLRYMTGSHVTGEFTCGDGKKWGNHWQSAWWAAKMALGAHLIWDKIPVEERSAVERVVAHEADRHLSRKAPSGALSDTKSEENEWDTEVMAVAVGMFPDHPHASEWRAKLIEFYLNSLSAPQDATSDAVVDGRKLSEQVYTDNIHSDFTIENHGSYHVCYMACPLHSVAWGRWALESSGATPPEAQLHHFRDVWERLKPTFLEKRFAYIEGKDWPRYAYGMYFIMPALVLMQQQYGDRDAREIEARRFQAFEDEQIWNGDGSFFGRRFTRNIMMDRQAEYETDCYANLGLCYLMHKAKVPIKPSTPEVFARNLTSQHISEESGFSFAHNKRLFASFAWRTLGGAFPLGLFVPEGMDDACEWAANNLTGRIAVEGVDPKVNPKTTHSDRLTDSGFRTYGRISYSKADGSPAYTHEISFAVDMQKGTAEIQSRFIADADITVTETEGLRLLVASDFFNKGLRKYSSDTGQTSVRFAFDDPAPAEQTISSIVVGGSWVNIDGKLGIVQAQDKPESFVLRRSDIRNGPWGSIHFDVLDCPPARPQSTQVKKGEVVLNTHFVLIAGNADATQLAASARSSAN
ncbi:MAG: hypothetical protein IT209_00510 [Armatimonadetes bacterium]|nr:hypothetical protein [Armatimonadota bacterium]